MEASPWLRRLSVPLLEHFAALSDPRQRECPENGGSCRVG